MVSTTQVQVVGGVVFVPLPAGGIPMMSSVWTTAVRGK